MKITALQEYGMRCIYQLAVGELDQPQTTSSIAEKEGLSRDYVEKILFQLRKSNIVRSIRGINGGYVLTRSPHEIFVGEIIMALSEKSIRLSHIKEDLCKQFPGKETQCVHLSGCAIRMLWSLVLSQVYGFLNKMPLSDLLGQEEEVQQKLRIAVSRTAPKTLHSEALI